MPPSSKSVVLATRNAGKVAEVRELLAPFGFELLALPKDAPEVEETGSTFKENAFLKAKSAAAYCQSHALADDSGLCVNALNGAPGLHSKRYGGDDASDADNNRKLLAALEGIEYREAYFICVLAWVDPESWQVDYYEGKLHGKIARAPRGSAGFGYDPIFIPDGHEHTLAELGASVKNGISHRAHALMNMVVSLSGSEKSSA